MNKNVRENCFDASAARQDTSCTNTGFTYHHMSHFTYSTWEEKSTRMWWGLHSTRINRISGKRSQLERAGKFFHILKVFYCETDVGVRRGVRVIPYLGQFTKKLRCGHNLRALIFVSQTHLHLSDYSRADECGCYHSLPSYFHWHHNNSKQVMVFALLNAVLSEMTLIKQ